MRGFLQDYFHRIWYGGTRPSWLLKVLAAVYARLVQLDRWRFDQGWKQRYRAPVPVIVVGNITAGGTGKTPLVEWVARRARELGLRVGIVSRGHGRQSRGLVRATESSTPADIGDEPVLLFRRLGCPVVVAERRADAVRALVKEVDLVVLDDGLQHHAVAQDFRIAVVDKQRGFGNGRLLPAGPLREPEERLATVNLMVTNGDPESMIIAGETLIHVRDGQATMKLGDLRQRSAVVALAGVGNPERFFASLPVARDRLRTIAFSDHHSYQASDLQAYRDECVVMTEKDAVKIDFEAGKDWWYLPIRAVLGRVPATKIEDALRQLAVD